MEPLQRRVNYLNRTITICASGPKYDGEQGLKQYRRAIESDDPEELHGLSLIGNPLIRRVIARRSAISEETLKMLSDDPHISVKLNALEELKRRADIEDKV